MPDTVPSPVAKHPATSTPQKASAKSPPPSFDLDVDIKDLTFSSVDDDGKDSSYQLSFEELDDTIEIVVNNSGHDQDEADKFEKMCSVPKYIVFEDKLLQLFKRCAICGDVLEKDLVKKGYALKISGSPSQMLKERPQGTCYFLAQFYLQATRFLACQKWHLHLILHFLVSQTTLTGKKACISSYKCALAERKSFSPR